MDNYVVAMLRTPAAGGGTLTDQLAAAQEASLRRLDRSGLLVAAGPVKGKDDLRAMLVFRTDSVRIARELVETTPAVKSGAYTVELHPWFSVKALGGRRSEILRQFPDSTLPAVSMQLALLTRGPAWTPERTPEVEKIQEGHIASINRLAGEGKLVIAGPFTDGGTLRGIFVFRTSGLEEAAGLTATDPAVIAGRLAVTLYEWSIPEAVIP
jgi:uncharacterized protein YciI